MTKETTPLIDTVLFDLDGTLIDSMPELAYCANQCLAEMGRPTLPIETLSTFVGKGLERLIIRFLANDINAKTVAPDLLQEAKEVFSRHYHANNGLFSELYPTVTEALEQLKTERYKLAVVTNKAIEFTLPLLDKKGISHYFDAVIGGDSCEHKKPHPAPVLLALEKLSSTADTAVLIGDSLNDAQAANAAGLPCLVVPYGYNEGQTINQPEPGALVDDMHMAINWIHAENTKRKNNN